MLLERLKLFADLDELSSRWLHTETKCFFIHTRKVLSQV